MTATFVVRQLTGEERTHRVRRGLGTAAGALLVVLAYAALLPAIAVGWSPSTTTKWRPWGSADAPGGPSV